MKKDLQRMKSNLEDLKNSSFFLDMKDTWNDRDFRKSNDLHNEIKMCKKKIEELKEKLKAEGELQNGED